MMVCSPSRAAVPETSSDTELMAKVRSPSCGAENTLYLTAVSLASWTNYTGTVSNVWYITLADDPMRIYLSNTEYWPAAFCRSHQGHGRWFHSGGRLYVYSAAGNPATTGLLVQQGNSNEAVQVKAEYVTFENLDLQGGHVSAWVKGSSHVTFQNCNIGYRCGRQP